MEEINKETYRSAHKFCRLIALEFPNAKREKGFPIMAGIVLEDISIDRFRVAFSEGTSINKWSC